MELNEIVRKLKDVCTKEGIYVTNDCIIDNSVKIFISEQIDKSKKENIVNYQNTKKINPSPTTSPNNTITPKQKGLLVSLGKYKEGMTKSEAFAIIKELKNKQNY